ncbi:MAG TPA: hypothetical protein VM100_06480 [Longimicrobiales bacterium]|nr:hypothetical protein [Longimicrobiales bacterium]
MRGAEDMMIRPRWCNWILALTLTACKQEKAPAASNEGQIVSSGAKSGELVSYAVEKTDTVSIEGTSQPLRMKLVQFAQSSVPALTYIPVDMISVDQNIDGAECHFFIANFAGKRNDDAYMAFCITAAGTSQADAVAQAKSFKASRVKPSFLVDVELKNHNGRFYYLARHYPMEFGDGMGPRIQKILEEWRWLDVT